MQPAHVSLWLRAPARAGREPRAAARLAWGACASASPPLLASCARAPVAGADQAVPNDLEPGSGDLRLVARRPELRGGRRADRRPRAARKRDRLDLLRERALACSLAGFGDSWPRTALFGEPGVAAGGGETLAWLATWVWIPGVALLVTLLPAALPDRAAARLRAGGRSRSWSRPRRDASLVGIAFAPGVLDDLPEIDNPYGLAGAARTTCSARCRAWARSSLILGLVAAAARWSFASAVRAATSASSSSGCAAAARRPRGLS